MHSALDLPPLPYNSFISLVKSSFPLFTDSTDDDKIVDYLWEMVKGPLVETAVTGDTTILNLKDLVPGNYTFK